MTLPIDTYSRAITAYSRAATSDPAGPEVTGAGSPTPRPAPVLPRC
ncbi:MAG: hypothetical protein HWD60_04915 [Defluviicoccus sp.]|nr:MAG: hypothetical protein HWD60_04915 [Defluviicoccus sp.]